MDQVTFNEWVEKIVNLKAGQTAADNQGKEDFSLLTGVCGEFADQLRSTTQFAGFIPDPVVLESVLDWADKPVFLCGAEGLKTGELQSILGRHPQLVMLPGDSFYNKKHELWLDACFVDVARDWMAHLVSPPGSENLWYLGQDCAVYEHFLKYLHFFLHNSRQETFICVSMAIYAAAPDCYSDVKHWVEKSPDNEFNVFALLEHFPNAKFIHITRDSSPSSLHIARISREQLGEEFYQVLRYEDLALKKDETLSTVCDFLEIQYPPNLLNHTP